MKKLVLSILFLGVSFSGFTQESFSIREAVLYGLSHHGEVRNAILARQDSELEIKELKASGLPQITGQFQYTYNALIPTQLIDAGGFNPDAPEGELIELQFGLPWGAQTAINLNQLIYDATWLVGLRAADTYRKMADQRIIQSKTDVAELITKAYYSVLVAEQRTELLVLNIGRLDSLEMNTAQMYEQGFVEKIELDRLTVQKNNLISDLANISNLTNLSYQLLKFRMGYDILNGITLTDNLEEQESLALAQFVLDEVNPNDRIEFQLLSTNKILLEQNATRYEKEVLPTVFFQGSLGATHSNSIFKPFENWFGSSALSIGVNVPIFDSGLRKMKVERQRLGIVQLDNRTDMLLNSFKLENSQATISLRNGLKNLDVQSRNLDLATEIVRVTKIKYEEGVGSNLEVVNAENDMRQAQTNYFSALYDVLIAKVDLDKAHGKLIIE